MAIRVCGEPLEKLVALVAAGAGAAIEGAGVSFVDDDQVGTGTQEVVAASVALDEVGRDHHVLVQLEEGLADGAVAFEARRRAGEDQLGVDVELAAQLLLPLLGERRRTEHGQALGLAAIKKLAGDEAGFDGLADAYVVRDEQANDVLAHGHQQGNELIRARLDCELGEGSEGTAAGTEAEADGVAKHATGSVVAEQVWPGRRKRGGLDGFEGKEDAGDFLVRAAEGTEDEQILL